MRDNFSLRFDFCLDRRGIYFVFIWGRGSSQSNANEHIYCRILPVVLQDDFAVNLKGVIGASCPFHI